MFFKLEVYKDQSTWGSKKETKHIWVRTASINSIEDYKWEGSSSINTGLKRDPNECKEMCIVQVGANAYFCAMTADKLVKLVGDQLEKEKEKKKTDE